MNNLRTFLLLFSLLLAGSLLMGQEEKPKLYDPSLDARAEINKMVTRARAEGKHVLLQIGGNW